jgi:hypothetical protein
MQVSMSESLTAFIILLLFYLGVLTIMSNPKRVLPGTDQYGSRRLFVDPLGNGDYTTIQAALEAAQGQAPADDSRWLVQVAPGDYPEALTLYNYIDIAGLAPGCCAHLVSPSNQAAVGNAAVCTLSNLRFSGLNDPIIQSGTSFSGEMQFIGCLADYDDPEVTLIQLQSGTFTLVGCRFKTGGRAAYVTGGTLQAEYCTLEHSHTDGDATTEPVIEIAGAAALECQGSRVVNSAASGGAAVMISSAPASIRLHHCLLRKASGSYSIDTSTSPTIYLGACTANAGLNHRSAARTTCRWMGDIETLDIRR